MEAKSPSLRKNPSRETCEGIIRRILMTEVLEKGKNEHFRTAADFMKYFESLYPASDALTKQVQRKLFIVPYIPSKQQVDNTAYHKFNSCDSRRAA